MKPTIVVSVMLTLFFGALYCQSQEDPYLWLEEIQGEKALAWVKEMNKETVKELENVPGFQEVYKKNLEIINSNQRIPYARQYGDYLYNFWRDVDHVRGIYRRTTLEEYRKENPRWETILDLDALAKQENENWVYAGMDHLYPEYRLALVSLSRGGADAAVVREFDIETRQFVKNGFHLPEAKSNVAWRDENSVFVGTDFGKGSLTKSGYPRIVKLWKRGTPLETAETVYEAPDSSVYAFGFRMFSEKGNMDFLIEGKTFYSHQYIALVNGKKIPIDVPEDAAFLDLFNGQFIIQMKSDWQVDGHLFKQGAILVARADDILKGKKNFQVLIEPRERFSIASLSSTKSMVLVTVLDNVVSKLYQYTQDASGKWNKSQVAFPDKGTISVFNTNEESDRYFVNYQNFLTPSALFMVSGPGASPEKIKSEPDFFDSSPYQVDQLEAVSKDGTRIPYFIIQEKQNQYNGKNPTLLYGYGGFEVSMIPRYSASVGASWLKAGGIYVLANIRGGGEFGPQWHQAGLKKNRHRVFEDFICVAEDLIRRKITSPEKLGIMGGSNGGLLVGTVFVMRPDLFKAVVCQVPLLDMKRYNKLLAGASWMAEYGNPDDPDMWEYIKTYSPYHNLKKEVRYPRVFFTTSTRDDRVHPGHSRKMVAKMTDMGHPVYYYENIEGGHGGAANNQQRAYMRSLEYAYLYKELMGK